MNAIDRLTEMLREEARALAVRADWNAEQRNRTEAAADALTRLALEGLADALNNALSRWLEELDETDDRDEPTTDDWIGDDPA